MADAIPVHSTPKRVSKDLPLPEGVTVTPPAAGEVANPDSPPLPEGQVGNPAVRGLGMGTPDSPVHLYSKSVQGLLQEAAAASNGTPVAVYELPGGAIRTDH